MGPASPISLPVVARFGGDEDSASLSVYKETLSVSPPAWRKHKACAAGVAQRAVATSIRSHSRISTCSSVAESRTYSSHFHRSWPASCCITVVVLCTTERPRASAWPHQLFKHTVNRMLQSGDCSLIRAGASVISGLLARNSCALVKYQALEGWHPAAVQLANVSVSLKGADGS